jgi:hypothetical protein
MKLLVWNVEKFTIKRLINTSIKKEGQFTSRKVAVDPAKVLAYFQEVFEGGVADEYRPEVIALLEVQTGNEKLGALLPQGSSGAEGLFRLLRLLKQWTHNNNWRLVPPLKLNPNKPGGSVDRWAANEVIGVFYDSSRIAFRGPNVWNAGKSQAPPLVGQPYGAVSSPWRNPAITGATTNAGIVDYYDKDNVAIAFDDYRHRHPFLVDMQETYGTNRLVRLLFMHTSPGYHEGGTREMGKITELTPVPPPRIVVCAGDFNVNEWNTGSSRYSYRPLLNRKFRKQLNKDANYSSHYRPVWEAEPKNWTGYLQHQLIDNFLVRMQTTTEANKQKYEKATVDVVTPDPNPPYSTKLAIKLADYSTYQGKSPGPVARFRQWPNFWHVRTTSDHTPIYLDIQ